jgi:hemerythrin-like domain-containing protein
MRDDTRDMYAIHTLFRREFGLMPALVRGVRPGDEQRVAIVVDHVRMLTMLLHNHHHDEDESLWPRLLQRVPEEARPVVDQMQTQHAALAAGVAEIQAELRAWRASAASVRGEALAGALDRMMPILVEHTASEEERAMPLIDRHITPTEWADMLARAVANLPPGEIPVLVGMLMYESGLEAAPPPLRSAMAEVAPRAYAAYCQRLYGTETPPRSKP